MEKVTSKGADKEEKKEKKEKDNYRVTNWSSYNKSLVGRGDITLWIDESVINEAVNIFIQIIVLKFCCSQKQGIRHALISFHRSLLHY
jgi:hypothetical protein